MKYTENSVEKYLIVRFIQGEDLLEGLTTIAKKFGIKGGALNVIGAMSHCNLGFFDGKGYTDIQREGDLEIASCMGNIAQKEDGETMIHAHIVVADQQGNCTGGHLMQGSIVRGTAEAMITVFKKGLNRKKDPDIRLVLLDLEDIE